ncbi:MAG: 50S ribosomal protein L6 [Nanoarchaeota archaeon]|nr:50S ribosomal protein L6 [Nanoarchaeota archaeon]
MKQEILEETIEFPQGVSLTVDKGLFKVSGPKGETSKKLYHPKIRIINDENTVTFSVKKATKKEKKIIYSFVAHLKNLLVGVTEGFTYKLKICSGHFPMNVTVKGDLFEIKNFIGEKVPRSFKIPQKVTVKIDGSEVIVQGLNKEETGQVAAEIEQLTKRPGFDKRIFQDGIYITEKPKKQEN